MSRSLLRFTPFISARIRNNQRLLSSALDKAPCEAQDAVHMTDNCIRRMKELQASTEDKMLRLSVETGGCSGFQYVFLLDEKTNPDDRVFEKDGVKLVVDKISYDFVEGATVDYAEELIRSAFVDLEMERMIGCDRVLGGFYLLDYDGIPSVVCQPHHTNSTSAIFDLLLWHGRLGYPPVGTLV